MKVSIFLSIALFLVSVNLLAEEKYKKEVNIIENRVEETILYNKQTNKPEQKCVCSFNEVGQVIEKVIYKQDRYDRWIPVHKYEMTYKNSEVKNPCTIEYTKWNAVTELWEKYSKTMNCIE